MPIEIIIYLVVTFLVWFGFTYVDSLKHGSVDSDHVLWGLIAATLWPISLPIWILVASMTYLVKLIRDIVE